MQQAVTLDRGGMTMRGMFHRPDGPIGKVPAVAIFHGFTGNKMEPHFIFVKLSRALAEAGIASVRFDFLHSGESDGDFEHMKLSGEVQDGLAVLDYLRARDDVDADRIGILGLSMGGVVASRVAAARPGQVKSLCLWAPAGSISRFADDADQSQLEKQGFIDNYGFAVGGGFIEDLKSFEIYQGLEAFGGNPLIIHGDQDDVVPLEIGKRYQDIYGDRSRAGDHRRGKPYLRFDPHRAEGHRTQHGVFRRRVVGTGATP
jgi:dienelactone hydrolase